MIRVRHVRAALSSWLLAGALAAACSDGGVVGGTCRSGFEACDGVCVDTSTDEHNCGGCGKSCPAGVSCQAGVCAGDAGADADASQDAPLDGYEGGPEADAPGDGTGNDAVHPDGDADAQDGTADGADAPDAPCVPPYNTPAQCGDCFTSCSGATPICALQDGGYACAPACVAPLVLCGSSCVDLATDAMHCGACDNPCPSGICQGAKCVGATVGHVVLLCSSYEQNLQSSPQTTLLGNAVFLPLGNPVRILAYGEHSPNAIETKVNQAIGWSATAKGRTYVITPANTASAVTNQLDKTNFDVLLVYDQTNAPAGALGAAGTAWASTLASFVAAGGVVVIPSGGGGTGQMSELVTNAGLLAVTGQTLLGASVLYNNAPFDAVGLNVLSPYVSLKQTCTWNTATTPGPKVVFVVENGPAGGAGDPVVIHRIP